MIEIKGLNLAFTKEYYALYNINLKVNKNEKVSLFGDAESGKTTLLRVLAGLEEYKDGEVLIADKNLKQIDFSKDINLGYVSYKPVFFDNKTVYENLYYVLQIRHIDEVNIAVKINQAIKEYGIENLLHFKIKQLSNYQKILVQLARVSLREIEIYLIDNIFQNVTKEEEANLVKYLLDLQKKEATFIIATSKLSLAKKMSEKIVFLKFGSIEKEE